MKCTAGQLQDILHRHKLWLEDKPGGERADLRNANLRWADLSSANLSEASLSGASLSGANLSGADLSGANLRWANLSGADLSDANLRWANLSGADLSDANLNGAILVGTDLSGANLSRASLSKADLSRADLREANLEDANLYVICADFVKGIDLVVLSTGVKDRIVKYGNTLHIGCKKHSIAHWLEHYQEIGKDHGYSPEEIKIYGKHIKYLNKLQKGGSIWTGLWDILTLG